VGWGGGTIEADGLDGRGELGGRVMGHHEMDITSRFLRRELGSIEVLLMMPW
jgi:hypothetical protein